MNHDVSAEFLPALEKRLEFDNVSLREPGGSSRMLLSGISLSMIAVLLAIHMGVLLTSLAGWLEPAHSPMLHFLTLAAAVVALAVRTLEEGLKPEREIERYTRYRSAIRGIRERFDTGRTHEEKLEAMLEMEQLASEEMGDFLRTHHHARFVM